MSRGFSTAVRAHHSAGINPAARCENRPRFFRGQRTYFLYFFSTSPSVGKVFSCHGKARHLVMHHRKLAGIMVVIGSLLIVGCKQGSPPSSTFPGKPKDGSSSGPAAGMMEAAKLTDEYKAGEATADGHYKGKEIEIKGTVGSVRDDQKTGKKYLSIKGTDSGRSVRCDFAGDQDHLAKLKAGDDVKVQGTCKGKQGTGDHFTVLMDNCKLLK